MSDGRGRFLMPMSDACGDARTWRRRGSRDPVHARRGELDALEGRLRTDGDGLLGGVECDDVELDGGGKPQSLSLADGEAMDSCVRADGLARHITNGAAARGRTSLLEKRRVLSRCHEANLMAVGLLCDRKAQLARRVADRRLIERADRKHRM